MSLANRTIDLASQQILKAAAGTAAAPAITRDSDTDTGLFFPAADTIAFSEGGTEAMRIDSSGNVGVGVTSLSDKFTVSGASGVSSTIAMSSGISSGTEYGALKFTASTPNFTGAEIRGIHTNGGTNLGVLAFHTSATERMRIDSSGNVGIGLTPTARNNTRLQIVDGIGFPATQVASSDANTLDDYEEGTFTPSFTSTGATFTHNVQDGRYTKIGRAVFVSIGLRSNAATGTLSNPITVTNLPFTAGNASWGYGFTVGYGYEIDWEANDKQLTARLVANTTTIELEWILDDAAAGPALASQFDASQVRLQLNGFYTV